MLTRLYNWLKRQRENHREKKLSDERLHRLNLLGFSLTVKDQEWNERYDQLVKFHEANGQCDVLEVHNEPV